MPVELFSHLSAPPADCLRRDAARDLCACAAAVALWAGIGVYLGGMHRSALAVALLVYGAAAALIWRGLRWHAPHLRFGAANRITLLRLSLTVWLVALAAGWVAGSTGESIAVSLPTTAMGSGVESAGVWPRNRTALAWSAVVVATLAALLDLLDGALARRHGVTSRFGARFDMECDALLIAVLSVLVLLFGKAGVWIVAAGALRYAFVAAGWRWPWLARPLPASTRRQAVCVTQIVSLIVALGPIVPVPWSSVIAGAGMVALAASFAVDALALHSARVVPGRRSTAPR
jgi:phosphatidylglycerophosphate synthase